jgi:hypothetical protein
VLAPIFAKSVFATHDMYSTVMNMTRVWSDGEGPKLRPNYVAPEKAGTVLKRKKKTHHLDLDWAVGRVPNDWW